MKLRKEMALGLAVLMLGLSLIGCSKSGPATEAPTKATSGNEEQTQAPSDTPKEIVTIKSIYPGDAPERLDAVLAALNEKMGKDIGVNLELTFAPWSDYYSKIQMEIAAGSDIDFMWSGSNEMITYRTQKLIVPINDLLDQYGSDIRANIDPVFFDTMTVDGQCMGVPSTANTPICNVYHCIMYREDLRLKYDLPKLDTIENLELYLQTIKENEDMYPILSKSIAYSIMPLFGEEFFMGGTASAAAGRFEKDGSLTIMPIQEAPAFLESAKKVHEWYEKGYIPTDIMNMDVQPMFMQGMGAMMNGSALMASERQAEISMNVPGAVLADQPYMSGTKYLGGNGGNAMYVASSSKHPEEVMKFFNWIHASQENYDLYCYGVEDEDYTLENDRITILSDYPALFPSWMFKNLNFLRFNNAISDDYIETIKHWDDGAVPSPLLGFTFNGKPVEAEVGAYWAHWSAYGNTLQSGTVDVDAMLPEFTEKGEAAGQKEIIAELQGQLDEYFANK